MNTAQSGILSWRRSPLLLLASLWAMLWTVVSLVENPAYLHDPSIALWQPVVLAVVPTAAISLWLMHELRAGRHLEPPLEPSARWFLHHLKRLPLLAGAYCGLVLALHHVLFGASLAQMPVHIRVPFQFIKSTLFYCLWIGLVYGTLSMIRLRERNLQLQLIQQALLESQLARLQAQLRPHFLFNTLNTVSSLMQIDIGRADRVLTQLGDLLRASLGAGRSGTVPLREELRLLRLYAGIMEERFAGRALLQWQIAAAVLGAEVPAMLLQPLLENAFKYGVEQTTGSVRIRIEASAAADRLAIRIHNTGSSLQAGWSEGIGVANCRERLEVLYGGAATLDIANACVAGDTGVAASLGLPLRGARP